MKYLLTISILMVSILTINAQEEKKSRKERRAEREAKLIEQTAQLIEAKAWQFDANQMLPSQGKNRTLTTPYSVVLKDDNIDSYLPFMGRAYSAGYGGTDSPMIFESAVEEYEIKEGKKGAVIIKVKAKNKNDVVEFTFNILPNGSTTLSVNSTNRQHITYYGDLVPIKEKEEK
jgi:hypothetical protein